LQSQLWPLLRELRRYFHRAKRSNPNTVRLEE
jgi:hypothetical protein